METHSFLLQLFFSGITAGSIYALVAVGFVTIYNVTGVLNFAQGEFAMIGAMITVTLVRAGMHVGVAAPLAVLLAIVIGAGYERLAIHPARHSHIVTLIIITIAVSIALRGAALLVWGADPLTLKAFTAGPPLRIWGASLVRQSLWVMGITAVLMYALYLFFTRTVVGTALRACVINRLAARLMGIVPERMSLLTFAIASGLGAIAGITMTPITGATYDMGILLGLKSFVAAVIGNLSSVPAAAAGALLIGVLEAFTAGLISSGYRDAITFVLLLVILIARHGGVLKRAATRV